MSATKKVVINRCFGGFGLSKLALDTLAWLSPLAHRPIANGAARNAGTHAGRARD